MYGYTVPPEKVTAEVVRYLARAHDVQVSQSPALVAATDLEIEI